MRPSTKRNFYEILQHAVMHNKLDVAKRMIRALPLHRRNFKLTMYPVGGNLLHLAASQDFALMVDMLLKCGLDRTVKNGLGETALQVAQDHCSMRCLSILQE
jgi:ankyrin repeat protein